jgi:aspartate/methionine/tyrosine aminotransferase
LQNLGRWTAEKKTIMLERIAALRSAFTTGGLRYRLAGAGSFFAYVEHPFERDTAKQVARRLAADHDLLCLPGSMFGPHQDRFLRLAFANVDAALMPQVAERLIESQQR